MKLKNIEIDNFRAIKSLNLDLHPNLTVLIGDNASGKSTILDALAIGLGAVLSHLPEAKGNDFKPSDFRVYSTEVEMGQNPLFDDHIREANSKAHYMRVALNTVNKTLSWDRIKRLDKTKRTSEELAGIKKLGLKHLHHYLEEIIIGVQENEAIDLPVLVYYGTERTASPIPERQGKFQEMFSRFDALNNALNSKAHFRTAVEWFIAKENEELRVGRAQRNVDYSLPELRTVRQAVEQIIRGCKNLRSESHPPRLLIDFQNQADSSNQTNSAALVTLDLFQLSDGFRSLLALVIDLARRMTQANPHLDNPLTSEAIVLIDEIDLHLHPKWQQTVLGDLMRVFENTQFIVTTHSPQVLSTIHKENIWILNYDEQEGILPLRPIAEPYGTESNETLHSLMNVDPCPRHLPEVQDYKKYLSLVNDGEYDTKEAVELRKKLSTVFQEDYFTMVDMMIRKYKVLGL